MKAVLINFDEMAFEATPISGRDSVLRKDWSVEWIWGYRHRKMIVQQGWVFGVATNKVPGWAMRLLRLIVNPLHMQRSSCAHDLLYATQGGRRGEKTRYGNVVSLPFDDVSRREADALAYALAIQDGISHWEARRVHAALRLLGKAAWDD